MSVPVIVNVLVLSSPPELIIDGLLPAVSTKADLVPTLTADAAPFEAICVTVLKIFIPVTLPLALGPVITSV